MIRRIMSATNFRPKSNDRQFANTLERGLRVLRCFSSSEPELGNGDISEATNLPKATVSRLTHTLVELGYLRRRAGSARFELSTGALSLGYPVLAGLIQFRRTALPQMAALAKNLDGACAVSVRDRLQMVLIESVVERDVLKRKHGAGLTRDLATSVVGAAWMVAATPAERERVIRDLNHLQPGALEAWRPDLDRCFRQHLKHGYVSAHGTVRPDTLVLSTALKRRAGEELLLFSCAVVAPAAQAESIRLATGPKLLAAAHAIDIGRAMS